MDVSDLRKRILRALDDARAGAALRRSEADEAQRAYATFLEQIAVPLLRQAQGILKAEHQAFTVHAPAGSARLASDGSAETFLEFVLGTAHDRPTVIGRVSRARGRQRVVVDERPLADKSIADLTDEDVAGFLVEELPGLISR